MSKKDDNFDRLHKKKQSNRQKVEVLNKTKITEDGERT